MAKFNIVERASQKTVATDIWSKDAAIEKANELHAATKLEHEVHKSTVIHISTTVQLADIDF